MKLQSLSIGAVFGHIFGRYHVVLFTLTALLGLGVALFFLNNILVMSDKADDYTPAVISSSFDRPTIERLNRLYTPSDPSAPGFQPSGGRASPFVE